MRQCDQRKDGTLYIQYFFHTAALRVQCEYIIEIYKVLDFFVFCFYFVNRTDTSRYRIASV